MGDKLSGFQYLLFCIAASRPNKTITTWHQASQSNSVQEDKAEKVRPITFVFVELIELILLEHVMTLCFGLQGSMWFKKLVFCQI